MCARVCVSSSRCESLFPLKQSFLWDPWIQQTSKPIDPVVPNDIMSMTLKALNLCVHMCVCACVHKCMQTRDRDKMNAACESEWVQSTLCVFAYRVSLQPSSVPLWAGWGSPCQVQWRSLPKRIKTPQVRLQGNRMRWVRPLLFSNRSPMFMLRNIHVYLHQPD